MEAAKVFSRDITATEYKLWTGILCDYTDPAVEWAFSSWTRTGRFFPKPAEILELIHAYGSTTENQTKLCGACKDGWVITNPDAKPSDFVMKRCECVERAIQASKVPIAARDRSTYGRGYGTNDIMWLWKARQASGKAWDAAMWELALDTLDASRQGGAPEWRR